jgi:Phage integrase, N-terminal SAM-like domain
MPLTRRRHLFMLTQLSSPGLVGTAARAWRQESQVALRKGTLSAASPVTLNQAAELWLEAAAAGLMRTRSGDAYKPSAIRAYRQALNHRVLPTLGTKRLSAISRTTLQDLADTLAAQGLSASSVRNTILPLRAIYRGAHNRGQVGQDPTRKLILPAVSSNRDRVAAPTEAIALLNALPTPNAPSGRPPSTPASDSANSKPSTGSTSTSSTT